MHLYKSGEIGESPRGQYRANTEGDKMRGIPLKLKMLENGCIIPLTHKLNKDGYFRYRRPEITKGRRKLVMFHRLVWEKSYGEIPKGYEIDHN